MSMDFRTGNDAAMGLEDVNGMLVEQDAAEAKAPAQNVPGNASDAEMRAVTMEQNDKGSGDLVEAAAAEAMAGALTQAVKAAAQEQPARDSKTVQARRFTIVTDTSRDALLTEFGKDTLRDRYLLPGENYQDLFARAADAYADDQDHAQRLYDYISRL